MINIRPISDLRNRFSEIEHLVLSQEEPVFLTKNGYGSMVVMSLEQYAALTDPIEQKLDEADHAAEASPTRYTADEVFQQVKKRIPKQNADEK